MWEILELLTGDENRCYVSNLPHDTGEDKLHNKQLIRPAVILQALYTHTHTLEIKTSHTKLYIAICARQTDLPFASLPSSKRMLQ